MPRFLLSALLICVCPLLDGQATPSIDNAQGESPMAAYTVGEVDNVNPVSGNVYLNIPLLSYPQRGKLLKLQFRIYYNDKQWFIMNWPNYWVSGWGGAPPPPPRWAWIAALSQPANASNLGVYVARDQHLDFAADNQHSGESQTNGSGGWSMTTDLYSYFLREPNGARHYYGEYQSKNCSPYGTGSCPAYVTSGSNSFPANDGSGYSPKFPTGGGSAAVGPDGTSYTVSPTTNYETVTDPQGNTITANASGWVDSLGRNIPGAATGPGTATGYANADYGLLSSVEPIPGVAGQGTGGCPSGTSSSRVWTVPGVSGSSHTYYLCYSVLSFQTAFNLDQTLNTTAYSAVKEASGSATMLTAIVLPNSTMYTFAYDQYLSLTRLALPTGAVISYTWQNVVPVGGGGDASPLTRSLLTRTVTPGNGQPARTWRYHWKIQYTTSGSVTYPSAYWGVVTDPVGNDVERQLTGQGPTYEKTYTGCSPIDVFADKTCNTGTSQLAKEVDYTYTPNAGQGGSNTIATNAVAGQAEATTIVTTLPTSNGNLVSKVIKTLTPSFGTCNVEQLPTSDGDSTVHTATVPNCSRFNQVASTAMYDYGTGQAGSLLKTNSTTFKYQTAAAYATASLMTLPDTQTLSTPQGSTASQTHYGYDESGSPAGAFGNLTSVTRGLGSAQTSTQYYYNTQGMPVQVKDGRGNSTFYTYDNTGLFLSRVQRPLTGGVAHTDNYVFDAVSGKILSHTDPNNQITSYSYINPATGAADPLDRLQKITLPATIDGNTGASANGYTQYAYTDTVGSLSVKKTELLTGSNAQVETTHVDGLGEVVQTSLDSDPQGADLVDTSFDVMGRTSSVSNPYRSTTGNTGTKTFTYNDALGRPTALTQPDGNVQRWTYTGATTTFTDEANNSWSRVYDALGRLTQVTEPGSFLTSYAYDANDNLTGVTQGSGPGLQRSFSYDALSHLVTATNPESGTTCYGTVSSGSCQGSYDGNGNLLAKSDANGIVLTYTYDPLNRLTNRDSPPVNGAWWREVHQTFAYDAGPNGIDQMSSEVLASLAGTTWPIHDAMGRPTGTSWYNYAAGAWQTGMGISYDLAGNAVQLTYPDGRAIRQSVTNASQLAAVTDSGNHFTYASGMTYWPSGSLASSAYNGFTESLQLNNRLQPCGASAIGTFVPGAGGGTPILSRSLLYDLTSTICGNASSNTGNIAAITNNIQGTSQTFKYDSLNRLTSAVQSAGAFNQTYKYPDAFGNMILQDNLYTNPSYSIDSATNRLLRNGDAVNGDLRYDTAGYLVTGPYPGGALHSFVYNGEGYLRCIDNCAVGSYLTDGLGQRSFAARNGGWNEYVYLNGLPTAELDQKGTWTDYIYANGRKIAKVNSATPIMHHYGTCGNCSAGQSNFVVSALAANLGGYTLQTGDQLVFQQKQTVAHAGLFLFATDGTNSYNTLFDASGDMLNASSNDTGSWFIRVVNLNAWAGKQISGNVGVSIEATTPQNVAWSSSIADVVLVSANGVTRSLFTGSAVTGSPVNSGAGASFEIASDNATAVATHYFLNDQLGTAQMELSAAGWPLWQGEFTPYGQEVVAGKEIPQTSSDGSTMPFKFTGKERDTESGLDNLAARYYSSTMGRFMSPDWSSNPVSIPFARLDNPQTLNRYSYVGNNPLRYNDPFGHSADCNHEGDKSVVCIVTTVIDRVKNFFSGGSNLNSSGNSQTATAAPSPDPRFRVTSRVVPPSPFTNAPSFYSGSAQLGYVSGSLSYVPKTKNFIFGPGLAGQPSPGVMFTAGYSRRPEDFLGGFSGGGCAAYIVAACYGVSTSGDGALQLGIGTPTIGASFGYGLDWNGYTQGLYESIPVNPMATIPGPSGLNVEDPRMGLDPNP